MGVWALVESVSVRGILFFLPRSLPVAVRILQLCLT